MAEDVHGAFPSVERRTIDQTAAHPDGRSFAEKSRLEPGGGLQVTQHLDAHPGSSALHNRARDDDVESPIVSQRIGDGGKVFGRHVVDIGDQLDKLLAQRYTGRVGKNKPQRIRSLRKILGARAVAAPNRLELSRRRAARQHFHERSTSRSDELPGTFGTESNREAFEQLQRRRRGYLHFAVRGVHGSVAYVKRTAVDRLDAQLLESPH